jgi:GT2 family glycosyltransferase
MNSVESDATLIIPQHEQPELTMACVRSLRTADAIQWPVIVVDDGSSALALETLLERMVKVANVTVLPQQHQGVTAAWNRAADMTTARFLVFLNNDTVSSGVWVNDLLWPLREQRAAVSGVRYRREQGLPREVLKRLPTQTFLEGWCFATRREDWAGAGGFDERFRLYFSDTDFQARVVKERDGDSTALARVAGLPVRHLGHQSAQRLSERSVIWREDRERFVRKWI